jgi:hypothetical protein
MSDAGSTTTVDHRLSTTLPADRALARAHRRLLRYHLTMVTQSIAQMVELAGGWLCDRAMSGWIVTVLVADPTDPLPARILGVDVVSLAQARALAPGPPPQSLAIAAPDGFDPGIATWMHESLVSGQQELTVWGDQLRPTDLHTGTEPAQYIPTLAARAFKARALAAAAMPIAVRSDVECYRTAGTPEPATVGMLRRSTSVRRDDR